jgi:hypothetical protein
MRLHLDALALMQRIWGALGLLTGSSLLILAVGTEVALGPRTGPTSDPRQLAVWVLATCGAALAGAGVAAWLIARGLRRRLAAGRSWALVMAIPNLLIVPFGTALGFYTFWVLLNDDARREFGRPPRGRLDLPG